VVAIEDAVLAVLIQHRLKPVVLEFVVLAVVQAVLVAIDAVLAVVLVQAVPVTIDVVLVVVTTEAADRFKIDFK
jgi:hypothetical protein